MSEREFQPGEVLAVRRANRILLICGMVDGQKVRVIKRHVDGVYYVSYLDGRGLIPVMASNLRELSPLEQLAAAADDK